MIDTETYEYFVIKFGCYYLSKLDIYTGEVVLSIYGGRAKIFRSEKEVKDFNEEYFRSCGEIIKIVKTKTVEEIEV